MQESLIRQIRNTGVHTLVVVSNRAPYVFRQGPRGTEITRAVSGLVSALEPIMLELGGVWVGWCGRVAENSAVGRPMGVPGDSPAYVVQEILLSGEDYRRYYHGFSNDCLWPLCHCFLEKCRFSHEDWESYIRVNERFAEAAAGVTGEGGLVWVHDYHLALVPKYLREAGWAGKLAFFWHIPFPPLEIFSTLPWRADILQGLLGSDLLAFHLPGYVENFLRAVERLLGLPVDYGRGIVEQKDRIVQLKALPIGINYREFLELARDAGVQERAREIRGSVQAQFIFLSVERLDYTKGIPEKLEAVEKFFERFSGYRDKVAFLQVAVPSRTEVNTYANLRRRVEEAVGRINGRFGENWKVPVRYSFKALDRRELVAHYLAADAALVTPLRDGLNLVAKEFVASRINGDGVLVISPFAGAAEQMAGALLANPYDSEDMALKIKAAVEMSPAEQQRRMRAMQKGIRQYDVQWWLKGVTAGLAQQSRHLRGIDARRRGALAAGNFTASKNLRGV